MPQNGTWWAAVRGVGVGLLTTAGTTILGVLLARFAIETAGSLLAHSAGAYGAGALAAPLAAATTGIGALVATWYALSGLIGTCDALARTVGTTWRAGELLLRRHGAPGVARLMGAGTGAVLTVGLALTPAQAEPDEPSPEPAVAEDLSWAAAAVDGSGQDDTDQPEPAPAAAADAEAADAETPSSPPSPGTGARPSEPTAAEHVVQPGDTLWAIAAAHLDPGASGTRIATAWPAWYEANRAAIGPDPDLILPGTVLHEPD